MNAFIEQLDFTDYEIDFALRHLLSCFRLPGEAQKIDRILGKFAVEYCRANPDDVCSNSDSAWGLAFAIIMLNTDAHSPQVKNKMTKEQFISNCRGKKKTKSLFFSFASNLFFKGINDGKDFPPQFLGDLYDRIVFDPIRLKEDSQFPDAMKKGYISMRMTKQKKVLIKWKKFWWVLLEQSLLYFKKPGVILSKQKKKNFIPFQLISLKKKGCFTCSNYLLTRCRIS